MVAQNLRKLMSPVRYRNVKPLGFGAAVWLDRYRSFASIDGI